MSRKGAVNEAPVERAAPRGRWRGQHWLQLSCGEALPIPAFGSIAAQAWLDRGSTAARSRLDLGGRLWAAHKIAPSLANTVPILLRVAVLLHPVETIARKIGSVAWPAPPFLPTGSFFFS